MTSVSKRTIIVFMIAALCLPLAGCMPLSFVPSNVEEAVALPAVNDPALANITGDSRLDTSHRATLYYISSDQQQLTPISRVIRVANGDETLPEKLMERLLEPSGSADGEPIAPEGTRFLSIEIAQRIATVNLSIEASGVDGDEELIQMRAAIANTLTEIDGIDAVNVLIGGMEESVMNMPVGTIARTDGNLAALYARYVADESRFLGTQSLDSAHVLERDVTLYFPTVSGERLLPETRTVRFESEDYITVLLRELIAGPKQTTHARAALPQDTGTRGVLESDPAIVTTEDGLRLIHLNFRENALSSLERAGISQWQVCGAITLTLCRFVPEINGIVIDENGARIARVNNGAEEIDFADGYMTAQAFAGSVGSLARLYFSGGDGKLHPIDRVMDPIRATNPRALIEELISGPEQMDIGVGWVVPDGIEKADILGIRVENDLVMINLSSNFYRCCQSLTAMQERCLVYSIVNTMTELSGVKRVRLYVDGEGVDTLVRDIYLRSPLIRNPGLIKTVQEVPGQ